jgi:hypothetical protein
MAEEKVKSRGEALAPVIAKAWKDEKFKKELLGNPKAVISKEFGVRIPDNVNVKVLEEDANNLYMILPMKVPGEGELSDEQLESVAGGMSVAPKYPWPITGVPSPHPWPQPQKGKW